MDAAAPISMEQRSQLETLSLEEKRSLLLQMDSDAFQSVNITDDRKVTRSLEVCLTGVKYSSLLKDQVRSLRFPNCDIVRIQVPMAVLEGRIQDRVRDMLRDGLANEVRSFYEEWCCHVGKTVDTHTGIWQSIGLKEFLPWLQGTATEDDCVKEIVASTIRYARKQLKWLDKKLCPLVDHFVIMTSITDANDAQLFRTREGMSSLCQFVPASQPLLQSKVPPERHECCGKWIVGPKAMAAHQKSAGHKRNMRKK